MTVYYKYTIKIQITAQFQFHQQASRVSIHCSIHMHMTVLLGININYTNMMAQSSVLVQRLEGG